MMTGYFKYIIAQIKLSLGNFTDGGMVQYQDSKF